MSTTGASAVGGLSSTNLSKNNALAGLTDDFDTFLTLLTTQLKNQDPLNPMDSSEFTNQIVQFTEVEQSIETNTKLGSLIDLNLQNQAGNAINYAGKLVEVESSQLVVGSQNSVPFAYEIPDESEATQITIRNAEGTVVFNSEDGETKIGRHEFSWDRMDKNGVPAPAGDYTLSVGMKTPNAELFKEVPTYVAGLVQGVNLQNGGSGEITLVLEGNVEVPVSDVRIVAQQKPAAAKTAAPIVTGFAGTTEYDPAAGPVLVDDNINITDDDSSVLTGAVIGIENIKDGADEILNVTLKEGIEIASYEDGILILGGLATIADYKAVIESLTYENLSSSPDTADREITINIADGANVSITASKNITFK